VDFVWSRGERAVGIEVKASPRWRSSASRALHEMLATKVVRRGFGVYLGSAALRDGKLDVLPLRAFLERLHDGGVIG
jgi:hypothetical protein